MYFYRNIALLKITLHFICGHLVQNQHAYQNANMTNIDNQQIYQNMNIQNNNVNYNNQNGKKINIVPIIIVIAVICFIILVVIRFVIPTIIFKNQLSEVQKSSVKTSAMAYIKELEVNLLTDSLIGNKKQVQLMLKSIHVLHMEHKLELLKLMKI